MVFAARKVSRGEGLYHLKEGKLSCLVSSGAKLDGDRVLRNIAFGSFSAARDGAIDDQLARFDGLLRQVRARSVHRGYRSRKARSTTRAITAATLACRLPEGHPTAFFSSPAVTDLPMSWFSRSPLLRMVPGSGTFWESYLR